VDYLTTFAVARNIHSKGGTTENDELDIIWKAGLDGLRKSREINPDIQCRD
jgi:hypothetical protein